MFVCRFCVSRLSYLKLLRVLQPVVHFPVVTNDVGTLRLPSKPSRFPRTINRVLSLIYLLGLKEHAKFSYVTFLPLGTSDPGINLIVSVPCTLRMPCASCLNSLKKEFSHRMRSSPLIGFIYSCTIPVIGWITELARYASQYFE